MNKIEDAALRCAIKRATKYNDPQKGFEYIEQWAERMGKCDKEAVLKQYGKWLTQ